MTSQPDFAQPPRVAAWLVTLFAPHEDAETIAGDLIEEFSLLASKSGAAFARSWYWRQTVRTIVHLVGAGLFVAPWLTAASVVGSLFLIRFVYLFPDTAIVQILDIHRVYEYSLDPYIWLPNALLIARIVAPVLVGCLVASAAKGREMTATLAVGLVVWGVAASYGFLWRLPPGLPAGAFLTGVFAFSIATVVGGAIVRMCRSRTAMRHSAL